MPTVLPSSIRNPFKFIHVFNWVLLIIFGYGVVHGIHRQFMLNPVIRADGLKAQFSAWWGRAAAFDRLWVAGCFTAVGISLLAWLLYFSSARRLEAYLTTVGFDAGGAHDTARFSLASVGWFLLFLVLASGLLALIAGGQFAGPRAKWGGIFLGTLLLIDLGRADRPLGGLLGCPLHVCQRPHHPATRHTGAVGTSRGFASIRAAQSGSPAIFQSLHNYLWVQHLFKLYNVQTMNMVQEPRVAQDKERFTNALPFNGAIPIKKSIFDLERTVWNSPTPVMC